MAMKCLSTSVRIAPSFLQVPGKLSIVSSLCHESAALYSSYRLDKFPPHNDYHKPTRLGQSQLTYSNTHSRKHGCVAYISSMNPVSNRSLNVPRCVLHCPRIHLSSLALSSRSYGLLDVRRFFTSQQGIPIIAKLAQIKGVSYSIKRNAGNSTRFQDNVNNNNAINVTATKFRLCDRTRSALKGRVSRLQSSILHHNVSWRDKIKTQRTNGFLAARTFHQKFRAKLPQKEDVRTIPNLLTLLRMGSAPVLAYLVVNESFGLACSIFVLAGITDVLDGYIARNFKNQRTALGTALDPLADKLLVCILTVSLTSVGLIPVPVTVLILGRDAGLIIATFYIRYITLAPPRTLSRYFDVSHVTAKLHPSKISKVNTLLQLSFVASTLASPVFDFVGHPLLQTLMYLTATTTFLSGADYMLTWRQRLQVIKNK
uniref:cardiolipin synthase (CMP-forming) n=1 Tax=Arion vulgaris TaxID=1028688 RepID=A0A0B6YSS7_9EUPU